MNLTAENEYDARSLKVTFIIAAVGLLFGISGGMVGVSRYVQLTIMMLLVFGVYLKPHWGMYLVAVALPFVLNQSIFLLGAFLFLCYVLHCLHRGEICLYPFIQEPALVFFVLLLAASTITSLNPSASIRDAVILAGSLGFFYLIIHLFKRRQQLHAWLMLTVLVGFLLSMYGMYQFFVGVPVESAWVDADLHPWLTSRVYSVFDNPNVFAGYLTMLAPVSLGLLWSAKDLKKKILLGAIFFSVVVNSLLTFSRSGWMGLMAAVLVFLWLAGRRGLIVLLLLSLIIGIVSSERLFERVMSIFDPGETSHSYRLIVWQESGTMLREHWLTGIGMGHLVYRQIYPTYMLTRGKRPYHSHNTFLQYAIEFGLVGLGLFLWFLFRTFKRGLQILRRTEDRFIFHATTGSLAAVAGLLVQGLGDHVVYMPKITVLFWLNIGVIYLCSRIIDTSQPSELPSA